MLAVGGHAKQFVSIILGRKMAELNHEGPDHRLPEFHRDGVTDLPLHIRSTTEDVEVVGEGHQAEEFRDAKTARAKVAVFVWQIFPVEGPYIRTGLRLQC